MSLSAVNNTTAFHVFTDYTQNSMNLQKTMSRLSTGVKTNVDDAAGIAISERMRSQVRNTGAARDNIDNTISMLQTADSWMQKMDDMLARMGELAVASQDPTKTTIDKSNIQTEFAQLQDEISRITTGGTAAGKFNGVFLFRGGDGIATGSGLSSNNVGTGNVTVQIGADLGQTMKLDLVDLSKDNTTTTIGTVGNNVVKWGSIIDSTKMSIGNGANNIYKLQKAIDHISNQRATLGAQQGRLEHTRSGLITYEDNLRAAESKVRDVDIAREAAELSKFQVLTQVSNAMLAQANGLSNGILQLVG